MTEYIRGFEDGVLFTKRICFKMLTEENIDRKIIKKLKDVLKEIECDLNDERLERIKIRFCIID